MIIRRFRPMRVGRQSVSFDMRCFNEIYCLPIGPIKCPHCPFTCENRVNLGKHQTSKLRLSVHSQEGKQSRFVPTDYYVCNSCNFYGKYPAVVVKHILKVHNIKVRIKNNSLWWFETAHVIDCCVLG